MLRNIIFHLVCCLVISFATAFLLATLDSNCESMCGSYYVTAALFLFPLLFLLGLPVPIGLHKFPKEQLAVSPQRRLSITVGAIGMLAVLAYFIFIS